MCAHIAHKNFIIEAFIIFYFNGNFVYLTSISLKELTANFE